MIRHPIYSAWHKYHGVPGLMGDGEISKLCPAINPARGANLLDDPGLEAWTSATNLTNYGESVSGSSTINQESTVIHGGSYACRMDIDSSNSFVQITQGGKASIGACYEIAAWAKALAGTPAITIGNSAGYVSQNVTTTYAEYSGSQIFATTNTSFLRGDGSQSNSLYFDDLSLKLMTNLTALVGTRGQMAGAYACTPEVINGRQAGLLVAYADADNYIQVVVDRSPATALVRVHKRIAGTTTLSIISGTISYAAGRTLKIIVAADGTCTAFYNNVQVGSPASVAVATLGKMVYGYSTHENNSVGMVTSSSA